MKMKRTQRTKNRKKNKFRYVVIAVCLAVFAFSSWKVGSTYYRAYLSQKAAEEEARRVQQQIDDARNNQQNSQDTQTADNQEGEGDDQSTYVEPEPFVLNFDDLHAINTDIIGWLQVYGTNINYPVLYSETDRAYYLYHNYWGEYDAQGSIFIENFNRKDLTDFDTIVYGHSMLNGNMFGTLHNFSDWNFFNSYGGIVLYTPTATYYYQVFETATIEDKHIFTYLDNNSSSSIEAYIQTLDSYTNGFRKWEYTITPQDHILTLSTCTTDDTKRLVVFAVLTGIEY